MRRLVFLLLLLACAGPAWARVLRVEEGAWPTLAAAVAAAADGDTIHLAPGAYYECAVLRQRNLVLEGPGAVLTDRICEGKALLVARGGNLTVRDVTLARARVADRNGAGIRLEAQGLSLERVRFADNEVGVLAAQGGAGQVRVVECRFEGGGVAGERPTAALMVGVVGLLRVERSVFDAVKGAQIVTNAARSELVGNQIGAGSAPGAGAAVQAGGGVLVMQDNLLTVGPALPPHAAAVVASGEGAELRGNRLVNRTGQPLRLLLDWMDAAPVLAANRVGAGDSVVSSAGLWRHRAGQAAREMLAGGRAAAGEAKRAVKQALSIISRDGSPSQGEK